MRRCPPCLRTSVCSAGFVPPDVSDDAVESVELEAEDEAVADEAVADSFVDADTPAEGDSSDAPEVLAAELADPPSDEELADSSASVEFYCCAQAANRQLPRLAWDGRHTCSICRYRLRRISMKINPSPPVHRSKGRIWADDFTEKATLPLSARKRKHARKDVSLRACIVVRYERSGV